MTEPSYTDTVVVALWLLFFALVSAVALYQVHNINQHHQLDYQQGKIDRYILRNKNINTYAIAAILVLLISCCLPFPFWMIYYAAR